MTNSVGNQEPRFHARKSDCKQFSNVEVVIIFVTLSIFSGIFFLEKVLEISNNVSFR